MDDDLARKLKHLRLYGVLAHWDEHMAMARKRRLSPVGLLKHIVDEEHAIKQENARRRRLKLAYIPEHLVMETFPFKKQPKLQIKSLTK